MKLKTENYFFNAECRTQNVGRNLLLCLMAIVMAFTAFVRGATARQYGDGLELVSAKSGGNALSLVEINNEFDVMVLRATD